MSADVVVGLAVSVSVNLSVDVRGRFRGQVRGCFRGRCHGCFRERFRGSPQLAVEIAVEIAMASAMGLHGVALLATAFHGSLCGMSVEARGRSAVARGVSAVVRGTPWTWPWNAVEVRGHCRGAPPKRQIVYIPPNSWDVKGTDKSTSSARAYRSIEQGSLMMSGGYERWDSPHKFADPYSVHHAA